ncbi:MAG TPA: bifunctional diaminohydroxyphosphoribosylaminopyrimidine deaminase/5-amino-6-(5-phosphoribosylamino)uracil reductase RibD [Opitutaceae bacterium]|nr:bifunctional diaminohydroxyphosphoribosylaminopyrimidine deaminase/5-amino-6-(5-phosphoribosylamino)uracil reductase RibD [Opitutaceae bacterium]
MESHQQLIHERFMRRALDLARHGWGTTHPNPMVGAIIVEKGDVVAEGFHEKAGEPHAEIMALRHLERLPRPGAVLYVTMEPCSTEGRTGACTTAIITAGFTHVVAGAVDPNPVHSGHGFEVLRAAGVQVTAGVLADECAELNLIFNHWIVRQTPLIAAKAAVTLDGKIATRTNDSQWITGELARADVHRWRRLFPAIAVGAGTVMSDDPSLTSRVEGTVWCPVRFIFDGLLRTVVDKRLPKVYTDEFKGRTIVVTTPHGGLGYVRKLQALGVQVWNIDSPTMRAPLTEFRRLCVEAGITGVYIEGGAQMISELIQTRQLDYLFVYRAPILLGDDKAKTVFKGLRTEKLANAVQLEGVRHTSFGPDQLMHGRVVYPQRLQVDEATFSLG